MMCSRKLADKQNDAQQFPDIELATALGHKGSLELFLEEAIF